MIFQGILHENRIKETLDEYESKGVDSWIAFTKGSNSWNYKDFSEYFFNDENL